MLNHSTVGGYIKINQVIDKANESQKNERNPSLANKAVSSSSLQLPLLRIIAWVDCLQEHVHVLNVYKTFDGLWGVGGYNLVEYEIRIGLLLVIHRYFHKNCM
jgi:hypothetical protein